ncbi:MAG: protein BatD [Nitrospirae bacterium]|nr:protein BatD [Nitrospirota bacterium]
MKRGTLFISAVLVLLMLLFMCLSAAAENVSFEISAEKEDLRTGETIRLSLTFKGTRDVPEPHFTHLDAFTISYIGPSSRVAIINGRYSSSIIHNYHITPLKTGSFQIGPLAVKYNGNTYTSNAVKINVTEDTAAPPIPQDQVYGTKPYKKTERVFITLTPTKTTVYINEAVPVALRLFARDAGVREIELPELSNVNISVGQFDKPIQRRVVIGGIQYETLEFNTTMFATSVGQFKLGPASLDCTVVMRDNLPRSFFDDNLFGNMFTSAKPVTLKSEVMTISVLPLPEESRPKDFRGAVGSFDLDVGLSAQEVKVGDPVTVKISITGKGNFNTVTAPVISATEDFKLYDPAVKQNKNSKTFEQAVIPMKNTINSIGQIRFSYFDPVSQTYHTITKGPFPLLVTGSDAGLKAKTIDAQTKEKRQQEVLGKDIAYIKEAPGALKIKGRPLYLNPLYWLLHVFVLLLYVGVLVYHRRRQRLQGDDGYARKLRAPKQARAALRSVKALLAEGKAEEFYDGVFRLISDYLSDKLHLSPGEATKSSLVGVLRSRGVQDDTLKMLEDILSACDKARYARIGFGADEMSKTYQQLEELIVLIGKMKL